MPNPAYVQHSLTNPMSSRPCQVQAKHIPRQYLALTMPNPCNTQIDTCPPQPMSSPGQSMTGGDHAQLKLCPSELMPSQCPAHTHLRTQLGVFSYSIDSLYLYHPNLNIRNYLHNVYNVAMFALYTTSRN